ncbi:MAG: hypothetical protein JJ902_03825 [Roseibium sp.]|nr:hypothetical protein [Roseibium sp.]
MPNLYKVTMSEITARPFFVVAHDEADAARTAEHQWAEWAHRSNRRRAVNVELVGWGEQHPPTDKIAWLIQSANVK